MAIDITLKVSRIKADNTWKKAKVKTSQGENRDYFFQYSGGNDPDSNNPGGIETSTAVDAIVTLLNNQATGSYTIKTMEFSNNKNDSNADICTITSQTTITISFNDNYSKKNHNINYSVIVNDTGDLHNGEIVSFECDPIIKNKT